MFESPYQNHFFIITIIFAVITLIAGVLFYIYPPKYIYKLYGYKTKSYMKNKARWDFAQKYSAKLMPKLGLINVVIALISSAITINVTVSMVIGLTIVVISVIVLIFKTEWALKCQFN